MKHLIRKLIATTFLLGPAVCAFAAGYEYSVDLTNVQNDRVRVEVIVPPVMGASIEYHMPKVVPGTYSISDFGRFVHEFKAMDAAGTELAVEHPDANRWKIADAGRLHRIVYWVEDTWDTDLEGRIFEPAGTNFEAGENFVLNPFGIFGYLDGMKEIPSTVRVTRPSGFYGSTPLIATKSGEVAADPASSGLGGLIDTYEVESYHHLADSPIMYSKPDTTVRMVGGAEVLISVYSPNQRVSSKAIMASLAEVLAAQKEYLGGTLPVRKYAFLIYLTDNVGGSGGMGALEHSYSSVYYMPETEEEASAEMMVDVAAHEFFHIVTPLSIHSEEIHYFDYINPKMSKHLWLYEGVTEYSASHVQIRYDLISLQEYLNTVSQKITMASFFNDTVPFTVMSEGCLDEYKNQYLNVYQKGALIGLALDIRLRELSGGSMGLQDLMRKLAQYYGKNQPFKDDELFDKITSLTYPPVREFFRRHVEGSEPLPYAEVFSKVGLLYEPFANREVLSTGRIALGYNAETKRMFIQSTRGMNKFGEKLGYKEGDELVTFDGMEVTHENYADVVAKYQGRHKAGDKILVTVMRPDGAGGYTEVKMKAKAETTRLRGMNLLSVDPNATDAQRALRKAWIGV